MAKKKAAPAKKTATMKIPAPRKAPQPTPPPSEQTRKPLDLEIGIKDFGPISSGNIKLKPLTVLIGPNNSGKSYAAMLIHSVLAPSRNTELPSRTSTNLANLIESTMQHIDKSITNDTASNNDFVSVDMSPFFQQGIAFSSNYFAQMIEETIKRAFSSSISSLVCSNATSFSLQIINKNGNIEYYNTNNDLHARHFYVSPHILKDLNVTIKQSDDGKFEIGRIFGTPRLDRRLMDKFTAASLIFLNIVALFAISRSSRYLPAARSGLLQGYKATVAQAIKSMPLLFLNEETTTEVSGYSGVVADFLSSLVTLPKEKGAYYDLAHSLELELLSGGEIVIDSDKYRTPEILFQMKPDIEIPLHRASSTVNEIAPIIIYLKYLVKPGELLIIEEPEAHLHPANQAILAKYLARLIRQGLNILITTHSEFMLEQINNLILASKVDEKTRTKKGFGLGKDDYLNPDEVGAYVFKKNKKNGGFKIEQVETTDEDGISEEEFGRVMDEMYEQTVYLRNKIEK